MQEEWREISEGYEVSSLGRVRSTDRVIHHSNGIDRFYKGKILSQELTNAGYLRVTTNRGRYSVHRLVAKAFCENNNNLKTVNHIDGNKTNNTSANLEWCSQSDNNKHAIMLGLVNVLNGSDVGTSKLTEEQAIDIICSMDNYKTIADKYSIRISQVSRIKNGKRWGHLWR